LNIWEKNISLIQNNGEMMIIEKKNAVMSQDIAENIFQLLEQSRASWRILPIIKKELTDHLPAHSVASKLSATLNRIARKIGQCVIDPMFARLENRPDI
jgi:hypothetical protein